MSRTTRGYLPVSGAAPDGEGTWEFLVSKEMLERLQRYGPKPKFYDASLIPEILTSPSAVFQGLNREGYEDAHCYSGIPAHRKISSSIEAPPPPGMTFLVYVHTDHRGHLVLDWEWRPVHPGQKGFPVNYESDFGRQTWPKTS